MNDQKFALQILLSRLSGVPARHVAWGGFRDRNHFTLYSFIF